MEEIQKAMNQAENAIDHLLEAMRSHLYMDTDRVFNNKQTFPAMVKFLDKLGGRFPDQKIMAQTLHWYINAAIWGRYGGSTASQIDEDLSAIETNDPLEALHRNLRQRQGERPVTHENFDQNYTKSRFYPLIYIMSRVHEARDWMTGNHLRHHSLGSHTNLEMHHIFPRDYLRRHGISGNSANNIANIAFQTGETNRAIGTRAPEEYMPEIMGKWPGTLESQWIPMNPDLWKIENYEKFLQERRNLLADAANEMIAALGSGILPPDSTGTQTSSAVTKLEGPIAGEEALPEEEYEVLMNMNLYTIEKGLAPGQMAYEVLDPDTDELSATLDLAWPEGLQAGYSPPIALLIDEDDSTKQAAADAGFRIFTSVAGVRRYIEREILAEEAVPS